MAVEMPTAPVTIGRLNEAPGLDLAAFDTATEFFRRGVVPAPWYLAVDGVVSARAVDISAQEDARQFSWSGSGKFSVEGPPISLANQQEGALLFDWRLDRRGNQPAQLTLGGGRLDISDLLDAARPGEVTQTRIPLRCFAAAGGNLASVGAPLRIDGGTGLSLTIRSVQAEKGHGSGDCPPPAR